MNVENVYPKVREIIADVLVIEEDDISLDSRLIADLGAESIDFLDLVFNWKKNLVLKFLAVNWKRMLVVIWQKMNLKKAAFLTPNGMNALKSYLSEVPEEHFKANMKVNEIPMLFTVETFCKLIVSAVQEQNSELWPNAVFYLLIELCNYPRVNSSGE